MSSTFSMPVTVLRLPRARASGCRSRSTEVTTSSALKGLPLWKVTPSRRVKRQRFGSTISHEVASAGSIDSVLERRTSGS